MTTLLIVAGLARALGLAAHAPASPGLLPERSLTGLPPLLILAIVLLLVVVFRIVPLLRQKSGGGAGAGGSAGSSRTAGSYGPAGAAVCSKCGLPFSRGILSVNLFTGKLERCPHCGKWQIATVAGREALVAAEARQQGGAPDGAASVLEADLSPEERLRRQIEDSKYERPQ